MNPAVLIFDVNETLIDIESLRPHLERILGDGDVLREWFNQLVMYSMTTTMSGAYVDFFTLGQAVLRMVGDTRQVQVTDGDLDEFAHGMRTMPAHPDVADGLAQLRAQGHRLVTLTNSPSKPGVPTPLENAGLAQHFDKQFSVDTWGVFKPSPQLYTGVAADLGVTPSACMMVAAHVWDTIGAQSVGFRGALITRPGNAPLPTDALPQPDIVVSDTLELAERLLTWDR
ncbi:2-haloalkanoic acid dehalogenase, type II [Mycolicibacterium rhodesiae NBB3]|uniref:2-haloalkanoic acid dehalogenase, type II n=1 Tax=Mycolicibacterium rhodesiae (strain NBB3) TaxID=710685 RepID=G8RYY2_MYCRN|nr:haloacid dehalogenase type II [Mycolicibacterium rhodesiae]AEV75773.1 2-haloalkanoic acid dehalogenase, type II [Mycolicibacterium rhodesiae NBB3]